MHLMYYLNEKGERVCTLKKSHGEEEQPTLSAHPAPARRQVQRAAPRVQALGCSHAEGARCPERLDSPGRPGAAPHHRLPYRHTELGRNSPANIPPPARPRGGGGAGRSSDPPTRAAGYGAIVAGAERDKAAVRVYLKRYRPCSGLGWGPRGRDGAAVPDRAEGDSLAWRKAELAALKSGLGGPLQRARPPAVSATARPAAPETRRSSATARRAQVLWGRVPQGAWPAPRRTAAGSRS